MGDSGSYFLGYVLASSTLVVAADPVQGDVGQQPVLRVGLPFERQAEFVADPAVRAVAPDDVAGAELDVPACGVAECGVHGIAVLGEAHQLDALLDDTTQIAYACSQQSLGLVLRKMEDKAIP